MKLSSDFQKLHDFRKEHQNDNGGFLSMELANEYADLYMKAWGSNLVFLGVDEKDGYFYPGFNVFD